MWRVKRVVPVDRSASRRSSVRGSRENPISKEAFQIWPQLAAPSGADRQTERKSARARWSMVRWKPWSDTHRLLGRLMFSRKDHLRQLIFSRWEAIACLHFQIHHVARERTTWGIAGQPCSPPSGWEYVCTAPFIVRPIERGGIAVEREDEGDQQ